MTTLNSEMALSSKTPFPHFRVDSLLSGKSADRLLTWFQIDAPWRLVIEEFYEQFEFSLLAISLPEELGFLTSSEFLTSLKNLLSEGLDEAEPLILTEIAAHKLVLGQTIKVHNDFIGDEETHRMLIQINDGWSPDNGGLLMIFNGRQPEDVADIIVPDHNSGFGFEISSQSFHAVSTIHSGERYTLVYTFKRAE